jgi:hypothetical protein
MGHGARAFMAASLGFAAAFVVACGSSNGLLSSDQAGALKSQLASISSAVDAGKCARANVAARRFGDLVGQLPSNVNTTVIRNLGQGAETVSQLVANQCSSAPVTTSSSSTTTSTTTTATETETVTQTTTPPPTSTSSSTSTSTSTATNPPSTGTTSNGGAGITTGQGGGGAPQNGQ